jgi:predicted HTH domain antitoxin
MMQVYFTIPDMDINITVSDVKLMLAKNLFEEKKLPIGKAADVAGLSYRDFYDLLVKSNIPVYEWTDEYMSEEAENAKKLVGFR